MSQASGVSSGPDALDVLTPPCGYVFMAVPKPYELFRRGMTLSISQSPVSYRAGHVAGMHWLFNEQMSE